MNRHGCHWRFQLLAWSGMLAVLLIVSSSTAGELLMKSGFRIPQGTVRAFNSIQMEPGGGSQGNVPLTPFRMLDDGMRRYFVGERQVAQENFDTELDRFDKFELTQKKGSSPDLNKAYVPPFSSDTQFNEFGHRIVTLNEDNRQREFQLGITQVGPHTCVVTGMNCGWEFQIATSSLPRPVLQKILARCIEPERAEDRFKVVRFFLQAGMYDLAMTELNQIAKDLPSQKEQAETLLTDARQLFARRVLTELKNRRAAGQVRLTLAALDLFPKDQLGADIVREIRQIQTEFEESLEKIERVRHRLGDLQDGLTAEQRLQVAPLRDEVTQQVDWETVSRLEAFLRFENDESLSSAEKLAMAYSGWVAGDANAITDLAAVTRWWQARFLVLEYLRATHPARRAEVLSQLQTLEGIGPKTIEQLILLLPAISDTPDLRAGTIRKLVVDEPLHDRHADEPDSGEYRYSVLVPPEFNPRHAYPVIVVLHEGGMTPDRELKWWGGDETNPLSAQRHGYLVIAPEYLPPKFGDPLPAPTDLIVTDVLRDVRRRFVIDSDRVFIGGHGRGAEAAFEVALARPDLFAGVLPISGGMFFPRGGPVRESALLRENSGDLAWFAVMGELDFGLYSRHAKWAEDLMKAGGDIVIAQYKARGHEDFHSETPRLFEWMNLHRRAPEPKEFELQSLRSTDVRLHWARWSNLAPNVPSRIKATSMSKPIRPRVQARILPSGNITLTGRGSMTLWLSDKLIDLDKRLSVEVSGQRKFHDFLKPEIETLLEDFRQTGDRQRLHSVRVTVSP